MAYERETYEVQKRAANALERIAKAAEAIAAWTPPPVADMREPCGCVGLCAAQATDKVYCRMRSRG